MTPRHAGPGDLEQLVLLALLRLGDDGFAPDVARVLEERAGREVRRGTLYGALDQLERKGLILATIEPPIAKRGGRRRRRFVVTSSGVLALREARAVYERMWQGLGDDLVEEGV